ncbi:MAG: hypothetical protein QM752_03880 [Gammaproteobacteria bacterium]
MAEEDTEKDTTGKKAMRWGLGTLGLCMAFNAIAGYLNPQISGNAPSIHPSMDGLKEAIDPGAITQFHGVPILGIAIGVVVLGFILEKLFADKPKPQPQPDPNQRPPQRQRPPNFMNQNQPQPNPGPGG